MYIDKPQIWKTSNMGSFSKIKIITRIYGCPAQIRNEFLPKTGLNL
jgi:hypothetical protein